MDSQAGPPIVVLAGLGETNKFRSERVDLKSLLRGSGEMLRDRNLPARSREWRRLWRLGLLRESGRYGPLIHLLPEWLKVSVSRWRRR